MTRLGGRFLARANALARALACARDLASDLDNAEVPVGALARANALALALADASALNVDRAVDLNRALDLDRDLNLALTSVLNFNRAHDLDRARNLALALVSDLGDLDPAAHWARAVAAGGAWSMPGRVSQGLVTLAVWVLPAPQRPRYGAELCAELAELPCRQRLGHSVRVLAGAWDLRRAVVEAARTMDGATAHQAKR